MTTRPSARLLVLDPEGRVLLFRFTFRHGALAGQDFWATPGGALEADETFEQAAVRELREETGLAVADVGEAVAERTFPLQLTNGEWVTAEERFFVVRAADQSLSRDGWTDEERESMSDHRWWSLEAIAASTETIYPENIAGMIGGLVNIGQRKPA